MKGDHVLFLLTSPKVYRVSSPQSRELRPLWTYK